jgi:hypothetical protein
MLSVARVTYIPLRALADELLGLRRNVLRYARTFPPGDERNRHLQVADALRALFKGEKWRRTHTLESAMLSIDRSGRNES